MLDSVGKGCISTTEAADALRGLHPRRRPVCPSNVATCPHGRSRVRFADVEKAVRQSTKGAAVWLDWWRWEVLWCLFDSEIPGVRDALLSWVRRVVAGDIPESTARVSASSHLIALHKLCKEEREQHEGGANFNCDLWV